jgi:hypothetical protein
MKTSLKLSAVCTAIILSITACKKENINPNFDRYIAGNTSVGTALSNYYVATLWINDSMIHLSDTSSKANAICIDNNDVYVLGNLFAAGESACYWKNGVRQKLPYYRSAIIATGIAVQNGDINICFNYYNAFDSVYTASVWHNGVEQALANSNNAYATAITINRGDVYVSGWKKINGDYYAVYWKNGLYNQLGIGKANDIFAFNNKIYMAGEFHPISSSAPRAMYWENNAPHILESSDISSGNAISVTDYGVTIGGFIFNDLYYWKDNIKYRIQSNSDESNLKLNDIVAYNNYVYSVGSFYDNNEASNQACYWENRTKYKLPDGSCTECWSEAKAIALKVK